MPFNHYHPLGTPGTGLAFLVQREKDPVNQGLRSTGNAVSFCKTLQKHRVAQDVFHGLGLFFLSPQNRKE